MTFENLLENIKRTNKKDIFISYVKSEKEFKISYLDAYLGFISNAKSIKETIPSFNLEDKVIIKMKSGFSFISFVFSLLLNGLVPFIISDKESYVGVEKIIDEYKPIAIISDDKEIYSIKSYSSIDFLSKQTIKQDDPFAEEIDEEDEDIFLPIFGKKIIFYSTVLEEINNSNLDSHLINFDKKENILIKDSLTSLTSFCSFVLSSIANKNKLMFLNHSEEIINLKLLNKAKINALFLTKKEIDNLNKSINNKTKLKKIVGKCINKIYFCSKTENIDYHEITEKGLKIINISTL